MIATHAIAPRAAGRAAYAAAASNLAAAIALALLLRPGLPGGGSTEGARLAYIAAHRGIWVFGWLLWNGAAVSLLAFYAGLAGSIASGAPLRSKLALMLATAGVAADISAEALYMVAGSTLGAAHFSAIELLSPLLTGYVANGLYTLAGIMLVWAGTAQLPRPLILFSVPVWAAGLALSASTLAGSLAGMIGSTAALMPLFVLWAFLIGRWLTGRAS